MAVPCHHRLEVVAEGVGEVGGASQPPHPPVPCPLRSYLPSAQALHQPTLVLRTRTSQKLLNKSRVLRQIVAVDGEEQGVEGVTQQHRYPCNAFPVTPACWSAVPCMRLALVS